ncbi:MAG: polysaccharide biosynthesis tyrosine autokinase [Spirulina sp. SIO3F2]|nr:polysaccharide biosynthesis tyrosine autokinase [Spirulina sp. SIO3F2]
MRPSLPEPSGNASDYGLSTSDLVAQADASTTIDLAWLFAVVRRRLWIMVLVAATLLGLSGAVILLKSRKVTPNFQGSFQLLVEPITAEGRLARLSVSAQSGITNNSPTEISKVGIGHADLMDYETQIRVLKSPTVLKSIVAKLEDRYPDLNYPSLYENLYIERISYEKDGKLEGTKILEVAYGDEDPDKIISVLEAISEVYLEYSLQERLDGLRRGIEHIDKQLPELEERVDLFQGQLQNLRETYDLSFPHERAEDLAIQSRELNSQRVTIQAELTEKRANYAGLTNNLAQGNPIPILLSSLSTQQAYGTLISQYQANEAAIDRDSAIFESDSPTLAVLYERRASLRQTMAKEARSIVAGVAVRIQELEARLAYINQAEAALNQKTEVFPKVLHKYSDLERKANVATESLKTFLTKREALQLDASQQEIPWELLTAPKIWQTADGIPLAFNTANPRRTIMIAGVLCTLVGVGAGFVVEILHRVYHTPEEIKLDTKLRLLGVIPRLAHLNPALPAWLRRIQAVPIALWEITQHLIPFGLVPDKANAYQNLQQSDIAYRESFRSLYTNISLLGSKQMPIRALVVSSATPNDGKSTVAEHLARTAAALGQRVLLVDADLRNPELHERLGLKNNYGLVDLVQHGLNLNEVIQQSPDQPNLFFLAGGALIDDPVKLLSSPQIEHSLEQFRSFFDLVIYNTPPLVGLSDAQLLTAQADGLLFVVRLAKTDRGLVDKALESLKISGSVVLGFIANDVQDYRLFNYKVNRHHTKRELILPPAQSSGLSLPSASEQPLPVSRFQNKPTVDRD